MRSLKSSFGVAGALLPVAYCGGLVYYFLDLSGSVREAADTGLGPTVIGLGIVGVLFSIPLFLKIVRMLTRRPSSGPGDDAPDDGNSVDADAAIARYKAQKAAEPAPSTSPPTTPSTAPRPRSSGPARTSFGRRNR